MGKETFSLSKPDNVPQESWSIMSEKTRELMLSLRISNNPPQRDPSTSVIMEGGKPANP